MGGLAYTMRLISSQQTHPPDFILNGPNSLKVMSRLRHIVKTSTKTERPLSRQREREEEEKSLCSPLQFGTLLPLSSMVRSGMGGREAGGAPCYCQ